MRHVGVVVALLAAGTHLPACAIGRSAHELRGQSGPVSWEIVDIRQELEENGSRMRWTFAIVLKNTSDTGIGFERVDTGSQPGGTVDAFWGGMGTDPFTQRLEPGAEFRLRRSHSWGCAECGSAHLYQIFRDGIIVYYTMVGRDDTGRGVKVPIAIRLNTSVVERQ